MYSSPVLRAYESAKTNDWIASLVTFSRLDILELLDLENDTPSDLSEK